MKNTTRTQIIEAAKAQLPLRPQATVKIKENAKSLIITTNAGYHSAILDDMFKVCAELGVNWASIEHSPMKIKVFV